jgi:hypothetical protein
MLAEPIGNGTASLEQLIDRYTNLREDYSLKGM